MHQVLDWISEEHRPAGELWTDFVSGAMPTDKRRQKLDYLKGLNQNQRGLLTNARCLSEGVDVPSLDAVAFIDPKNSQVDIVQAVGRAIRLSQDKKFGTIVIPVFIEQGDDAVSSIEASKFKPVWEVLNAFKSHDEELSQQLDTLRTELGRKSGSTVGSNSLPKVTIDLPSTVDASFSDSLCTYLVNQSTASWYFLFGLLESYVKEHSDTMVPIRYITSDGFKLGSWASRQRRNKVDNSLSQDRIDRLEALSGWTWDPFTNQWENSFEQLKCFTREYGNADVSIKYIAANGFKLGTWVSNQRKTKSKKALSQDRIDRLEALSGWTWDPFTNQWEESFGQLQFYVKEHGNAALPQKYINEDGYKIRAWVGTQRTNKANNSLSQERINRLEALNGWCWDVLADRWEEGFELLQCYVEEYGNARVKTKYISSDGFKLGSWASRQRTYKDNNSLSHDRIARIEAFKGWTWDPMTDQWEEGFEQLQCYLKKHGKADAPMGYISSDGFKLGNWIGSQRLNKSKNAVSQDRIDRLEALSGWT